MATPRTAGRAAASLLGGLMLGACSVVGVRSGTPQPDYSVLERIGAGDNALEIRRYGARLAAESTETGTEIDARYSGFRRLAGFIFGGNATDTHIAMTAPVVQAPAIASAAAPGGWIIRFILPAGMTRAQTPEPNDRSIRIVPLPAETVAVLRFSGSPNAAAVADRKRALLDALRTSSWHPAGTPSAWFYDPPWTLPPLRRNEVSVPVAGTGG